MGSDFPILQMIHLFSARCKEVSHQRRLRWPPARSSTKQRGSQMPKVLYEKRGEIAYITLNRPDKRNAIDTETDDLLFEAWSDFRADPDVRLAILTGAGDQAFCAGADLS